MEQDVKCHSKESFHVRLPASVPVAEPENVSILCTAQLTLSSVVSDCNPTTVVLNDNTKVTLRHFVI